VPAVVHGGRIWRAWEEAQAGKKWGENFRPFVMSTAEDADLLKAESWTRTNALAGDKAWLNGTFGGWLEGNVVVTPEGRVVDVLREVRRLAVRWRRPDRGVEPRLARWLALPYAIAVVHPAAESALASPALA
jgi:hypothetical protein